MSGFRVAVAAGLAGLLCAGAVAQTCMTNANAEEITRAAAERVTSLPGDAPAEERDRLTEISQAMTIKAWNIKGPALKDLLPAVEILAPCML